MRTFGREAEIARKRKLEPAADAGGVVRDHAGLLDPLKLLPQVGHAGLELLAHVEPDAGGAAVKFVVQRLGHVGPGAEIAPDAADQQDLVPRFVAEVADG